MLNGVLILFGLLFLLNGFLYLRQPDMVFFPLRQLDGNPSQWGLVYEDVFFDSTNGKRIHGWFVPSGTQGKTILFFHGNGGNISHRRESIEIFHRLGMNVFIIDYQGYGRSEGKPSEKAMAGDARSAWQYLTGKRGLKPSQVIIFGRSLGGAVAARLAGETKPAALILESTFSSVNDMARELFPLLSWLIYPRYRFATAEHVSHVTAPLLYVHSRGDDVIPFHLGERVYQSANRPKVFLEIHGDHNSGFARSQPGYEQALGQFLDSDLLRQTGAKIQDR